jgi:hypothetical protein
LEDAAMTRVSTTELSEQLPDILVRVVERGEQFVVERDGVALAIIQPPPVPLRPTLHEFAALLADVEWPDPEFADDIEAARAELNTPIELPEWPS